jgi:hypothetical protein
MTVAHITLADLVGAELTHPLAALPKVDAWVRSQIAALCQEVRLTDADFDPLFSPCLT